MQVNKKISANSKDLQRELSWFTEILNTRFKTYFGQESEIEDIFEITPPDLSQSVSNWATFIKHYQPNIAERLAILLALIPDIAPRTLDIFLLSKNSQLNDQFTEFGGVRDAKQYGFLPTVETLLFIISGSRLDRRFQAMHLFQPNHFLMEEKILHIKTQSPQGSLMSGAIRISSEHLHFLTIAETVQPAFGSKFPAQQIQTDLDWQDLVLSSQTRSQIKDIEDWLTHGNTLLKDWGLDKKLPSGFRCLFHGPPGTGKNVAARLLGKTADLPVYRVNLALVISKYIGETEKNLANLFTQAKSRQAILFFDEADAVFGKRTESNTAQDRYANQEVAYLLQRIEDYDGLIILAATSKDKFDAAFIRRFQSVVAFPIPEPKERFLIWQKEIPEKVKLAADIDLQQLAEQFELSRGSIINIISHASLKALGQGTNEISLRNLQMGIRQEFVKNQQVF